MKIIETIKNIESVISDYQDLLGSDVSVLRSDAVVHDSEQIEKTIKDNADKGRLLQIGIIGRVKAGKSSLLNALFFGGEEVLPKAATPMTASLTTLKYGETPAINVEFFTEKDLREFERLHKIHEEEINKKEKDLQENWQNNINKNSAVNAGIASKEPDFRKNAKNELEKSNPMQSSSWELWNSVIEVDGIKSLPEGQIIECNGIDDLQGKLVNYVGSKGKYTPFTKCLHLTLPIETLRDICIVDTPGLDDPIISRVHRTQVMLKECDSVFIVSPAGQFLNEQDEKLVGRLIEREGISTYYLVASQFDTQLFGNEKNQANGVLSNVVELQKNALLRHSKNILSKWATVNKDISNLNNDVEKNMRVCSSVAHSLLSKNISHLDENEAFVIKRLRTEYKEFFNNEERTKHWLNQLSGIPAIQADVKDIKENKLSIFEVKSADYVSGQTNACKEWKDLLLKRSVEKQAVFQSSDLATIEEKIAKVNKIAKKGIEIANSVFSDQIELASLNCKKELRAIARKAFEDASDETSDSRGSITEQRSREKSGLGSWIARKLWDGGSETYTKTISTIDSRKVKSAIKNFRDVLQNDLKDFIDANNINWRNNVPKSILEKLRDSIGDENVNNDEIRKFVKYILLKIADVPEPELPDMPEDLAATGILQGSSAESYQSAAESYLELLRDSIQPYVDKTMKRFKEIQNEPLGNQLFEEMLKEAEGLKEQFENKKLTAERFKMLLEKVKTI